MHLHFKFQITDWTSHKPLWESRPKMVKRGNVEDRNGSHEAILHANFRKDQAG